MNVNQIRIAIGTLLCFLPGLALAQSCTLVQPHAWRWWSNLAYGVDTTSGWSTTPATYSWIIANKSATYTNTDLNVGMGPNGEGKVRFLNSNFGAGAPDAWARVWSGSLECTWVTGNNHWYDNGICNGSSLKGDEGRITFNDYEMGAQSLGLNTLIVLHETGHIFGMQHKPQACSNTFMVPDPYVGQSDQLDSFEVTWINATY